MKTFEEHLAYHLPVLVSHMSARGLPVPRRTCARDHVLTIVSERAWRASVVALAHIPRTKTARLDLRLPRLYCEHRIHGAYVSQTSVLLALLSCGVKTRRDGPDVKVGLVSSPPEMSNRRGADRWAFGSVYPPIAIADHEAPWPEWVRRYGQCFDGPQECPF